MGQNYSGANDQLVIREIKPQFPRLSGRHSEYALYILEEWNPSSPQQYPGGGGECAFHWLCSPPQLVGSIRRVERGKEGTKSLGCFLSGQLLEEPLSF